MLTKNTISELKARKRVYNIFIDGTKIEVAANKYTFVWKKFVTKNQQKVLDKIPEFILKAEENFGAKISYKSEVKIYHLKKLRKKLKRIQKDENIVFVHGMGKRKSLLQKTIEQLDKYISRIKCYNKNLYIMGSRNSFSKTDHDATFMRMKEDAMKNGQLKPAYNVQFGIDSEYVAWITVGPNCSDNNTFILFLNSLCENWRKVYMRIIADSGYESEENYVYLEKHKQLSLLLSNLQTMKSAKHENIKQI